MSIETHPIGWPVDQITMATWWPGLDFEFEAAAAGVEATLVRATETNSARSLTVTKYADLIRATESSAARAVSVAHYADLGRATEASAARSLSVLREALLGRATETDSARSGSALRLVDLTRATETDSARVLTPAQVRFADLIRAIEASSARGLTVSRSYTRNSFQVVLHEEETGESQTVELGIIDVVYDASFYRVAA